MLLTENLKAPINTGIAFNRSSVKLAKPKHILQTKRENETVKPHSLFFCYHFAVRQNFTHEVNFTYEVNFTIRRITSLTK